MIGGGGADTPSFRHPERGHTEHAIGHRLPDLVSRHLRVGPIRRDPDVVEPESGQGLANRLVIGRGHAASRVELLLGRADEQRKG